VRGALVAAGLLPYVAFALRGDRGFVAEGLSAWFRFQCHGRADRSLSVAGEVFPVCSRCMGIYSGLALASLLALPRVSARARRAWLVGAAVAMVLEVQLQDRTGHAPIHALRLLTGLALAWPVALIVLAALAPAPTATDRSPPTA
jgi:uncharacterized membrane protein